MKSKLKQYKIHITLGIFFIVIIPLSYLGAKKLIEISAEKVASKQGLQVENEVYLYNTAEIIKLRKDINYIKENNKKINLLKKGTEEANIELYGELEDMAISTGNSNVFIDLPNYISATSEKKNEFVIEPINPDFFYVTIEMVGTFNDALRFLHALDNMRYISDVISFSMKKPKKVEGKKLKDEIDRYGGKELIKSEFDIVFYLKTDKDSQKNKKIKVADPNVDMKLVEEAKKSPLPKR